MTTQIRPTSTRSPENLGLPPPNSLELVDTDQRVGWLNGDAIGFGGFASEIEAAHAAWLAYRAVETRLARRAGRPGVPVAGASLALEERHDTTFILGNSRRIATLIRPGLESRSGDTHFGFELQITPAADEHTMRSLAFLAYRTLRRSGTRWRMWRRGRGHADSPSGPRRSARSADARW